jgi:hypothetical protein
MPTPTQKSRRRSTLADLRKLQRQAASVIMRRLDKSDAMQKTWIDGGTTQDFVSTFVKPNDRLTSSERIEIYNRQYWYRMIDVMHEDYPGVLAVIGQQKFNRLVRAYIDRHPSRSFTLRNLGRHFAEFIAQRSELTAPRTPMALDMARFEWAQVVAFDGPEEPALSVDDLLGRDPNKLRIGLQPFLGLLDLAYPLDDFDIDLKRSQQGLRSEASNAVDTDAPAERSTNAKVKLPRKARTFVAVHRIDNDLYYKRLTGVQFRLLTGLRNNFTLAAACNAVAAKIEDPAAIGEWFKNWAGLGWFCKPGKRT